MKASNIQLAAAGRAYQSVAQSAAIAIQDGTDYLRNVGAISTTSIGVGMAMLIVGNANAATVIQQAQKIATDAVTQFGKVSSAAVKVASEFPKAFG